MQLRTKPQDATAIQWTGEVEVAPTGLPIVEQADEMKDLTAAERLDLVRHGEMPTHNIDYVTDFVGGERVRLSGHGLSVWVENQQQWLRVPLDHYIVKDAAGGLSVLDVDQITAWFEVLA